MTRVGQKIIPVAEMTDGDMLDVAWRCGAPAEATRWPRERLVEYIEAHEPPCPQVYVSRGPRPRMPKNLGVGRYCREILATVIRTDASGPWGLSYAEMMKMAKKKFPDSCVDERHLRWYAAQMRREDMTIPVNRERSSWK